MHVIVWTAGQLRYAVESRLVREVIPMVQARAIPGLPPWCRGVIDYRQQLISLLDGPALLDQAVAAPRMGNRILVLRLDDPQRAASEQVPVAPAPATLVALVVDSVLDTADLDFQREGTLAGLRTSGADFLGPLVLTPHGTIQLLDPLKLPRLAQVAP